MKIQTREGSLKGEDGTFVFIQTEDAVALGKCLRKLSPNILYNFGDTGATIFLDQKSEKRLGTVIEEMRASPTITANKCETCGDGRTLYSVNRFLVCLEHSPFRDVGCQGYVDKAGVLRAAKAVKTAKNTADRRRIRAKRVGRPLRKFSYVTALENSVKPKIEKSIHEHS
jgi:hypothetical protein